MKYEELLVDQVMEEILWGIRKSYGTHPSDKEISDYLVEQLLETKITLRVMSKALDYLKEKTEDIHKRLDLIEGGKTL